MKNYTLRIILLCLIVWPVKYVLHKKKSNLKQKIHRTGEIIALDNLIRKFEKEHQQFYEDEIKDGNHLEWPAVDNRNLSNYCRKYLERSILRATTVQINGTKRRRKLHYEKRNVGYASEVVVVQCRIMYESQPLVYHMTRAPEPNCVYSLKCTIKWTQFLCTIINKHCGFEDDLSINRSQKRKISTTSITIHHSTGQPIADDKHLLRFEKEHQEMVKEEEEEGKCIEWPNGVIRSHLDSYCYQYLKKCVPNRKRENVKGILKTEKFLYQHLNTNEYMHVTTVTCSSLNMRNRQYHITRAPGTNCVYALLRKDFKSRFPLVIVFKHCNFEDVNDPKFISPDYIIEKNVIPKTEIKEENETFKTLKFFS